jgi:mono/diheme cytochrome c family protein
MDTTWAPERTRPARPRRISLALTAALALGALLVAGCGDGGDDDRATGGTSAGAPEAGEVLYAENCASCHGDDLRGTDKGPSHLSRVYEPGHHSDASFVSAIRNGSPQHHWDFGDMEPVEGLSDDEVDAIIAFVRQKQADEGFES